MFSVGSSLQAKLFTVALFSRCDSIRSKTHSLEYGETFSEQSMKVTLIEHLAIQSLNSICAVVCLARGQLVVVMGENQAINHFYNHNHLFG